MNSDLVLHRLRSIASSGDFASQSSELTREWASEPNGFEAVEPILRFMEEHPSLDYGMPGPLVHFVEGYLGMGYEQQLIDSINRQPTTHTVWMLNRLINGTRVTSDREHLLGTLRRAEKSPVADVEAKRLAAHFLARLSS